MSINPLKSEKILQFSNDVEYKARMSVDTIVRIEQTLGISILFIANSLSEAKLTLTQMIQLITLAIRAGGNDIKEKDVKKLISGIGLVQAVTMCSELLTLALNVPDDDVEEKKSEEVS